MLTPPNHSAHQSLHGSRVISLDLASLVAGSGIRGQFESKFKALLRDIEESEGVICFIDELRKRHCITRWKSQSLTL